jgi:hypothetical protein
LEVSREFASSSEYARAFTAKHGADLEPSASSVQQMFGGGGTFLDKLGGGGPLGESTHQRDFVPWLGVKPAENAVLARLADSDEDHPLVFYQLSYYIF